MISAGKLIEYLDNGRFICAFVSGIEDKRLRLLNQNSKELLLPAARIMHVSRQTHSLQGSREQLIAILQEANTRRSSLVEQITLDEIWELAIEESSDSFDPAFLAELTLGQQADDDIIAAFLRAILLDKLYFRFKEGEIKAQSREQVALLLHQREKERQKIELIHKGAAILQAIMQSGSIPAGQERLGQECLELISAYYLETADPAKAEISRLLLKEAGLNHPHAPFHLLVQAGIWHKNENIALLKSSLPVTFSLSARQQAETILQQRQDALFEDTGRQDFTALRPITIDGQGTLDFDDALTIEKQPEGYLVGIHISDVAHYVHPGDALFQEALQRGTSLYFPEGQIPMLPRHLSQGICSLIQDETRAAISFMILLSPEAQVLRTRICPSIIRVARRLTYDEADRLMEEDQELSMLNMLRRQLRNRRLDQGALLLPFPDVNIFIDPHGKVHVSLGKTDTPARTLVSEMMILANSEAARYVADRMAPGLFRSQPPLKNRIVHGEDDDLFLNTRQRKQIPRGELLTRAQPHSGLGVSHYTTVTSPIRRLLDLVMQHQLNAIIRRQPPCFTESMCRDFVSVINRTLAASNAVKHQRHRYWLLKYLEERIDQPLSALVIEAGSRRINLLLTDLLMDVELAPPSNWQHAPGATVQLRVVKADALDNTIKFDWY